MHYIGSNGAGILLVDGTKIEKHINSDIYYSILDLVYRNGWDALVVCSIDFKWLWNDFHHYPFTQDNINTALLKSVTLAKKDDIPHNYPITKVSIILLPEL